MSTIEVATEKGQALTEVRIDSEALADDDLATLTKPGTPVVATLQLRDDGPLAGVSDQVFDFLRQIGLKMSLRLIRRHIKPMTPSRLLLRKTVLAGLAATRCGGGRSWPGCSTASTGSVELRPGADASSGQVFTDRPGRPAGRRHHQEDRRRSCPPTRLADGPGPADEPLVLRPGVRRGAAAGVPAAAQLRAHRRAASPSACRRVTPVRRPSSAVQARDVTGRHRGQVGPGQRVRHPDRHHRPPRRQRQGDRQDHDRPGLAVRPLHRRDRPASITSAVQSPRSGDFWTAKAGETTYGLVVTDGKVSRRARSS